MTHDELTQRALDQIHRSFVEGRRADTQSLADLKVICDKMAERAEQAEAEAERLNALINNPSTDDFISAVRTEMAHQRERWDDAQKSDADFMWALGWLAGKAVHAPDSDKRLHHIITSAALCGNWFRART